MPTQQYHPPATLIVNRYRIVRELGQGGFGCTYLVEDIHRFNERCVLKEFAPASESSEILLTKAKELFVREAAVLYKLEHLQIPRFREWFMGHQDKSLCLVQDYVEGATYQTLLRERVKQGKAFSESEIYTFLIQILPVLDYIHRQGLIHRDISPDNLIQRQSDSLPILIDFGGVKQITASFGKFVDPDDPNQQFSEATILGKPGYAPDEQIRLGKVFEHSDLYALGVTALVMLMGQEPREFYDTHTRAFQWRQQVEMDSEFARVLDTMVATQAHARYPSAQRALRDLEKLDYLRSASSVQANDLPTSPRLVESEIQGTFLRQTNKPEFTPEVTQHTVVAEPVVAQPGVVTKVGQRVQRWTIKLLQRMLVLAAIATLLGGIVWAIRERLETISVSPPSPSTAPEAPPESPLSREELDRKARLFDRIDALGVPSPYFSQITNEAFFLEYPEYQGRSLTRSPADAPLRKQWDEVGLQVLEAMGKLDPEARDRIGQYRPLDRQRIDTQLQEQQVNKRRFYRQVEKQLMEYLPMYRDVDLDGKQAQQLWFAIAQDQLLDLEGD